MPEATRIRLLDSRQKNIAEIRFKEDDVSELDIQQATANLTTTRASLPTLHQNRQQVLNRLAILLGMTPYDLEPILREPGSIPTASDEVVVGIPAEQHLLY